LSKEEVEKMARDAEAHSAEDNKRKDEIDARNRADSMVYQVEKMLKDHRDKISDADAKNVDTALEAARKAMADGKIEDINRAVDNLTQASHKLAEAMYKASSTGGAEAGGPPPGADGAGPSAAKEKEKQKENVVDAEFVDVDEQKK
jgi:molecular chaperone DnaK